MRLIEKFYTAIDILKSGVGCTVINKPPETEEEFNSNCKWEIGADSNNNAIYGDRPTEITWTLVKAEMDRLQVEYDAQDYARKRKAEYPSVNRDTDRSGG